MLMLYQMQRSVPVVFLAPVSGSHPIHQEVMVHREWVCAERRGIVSNALEAMNRRQKARAYTAPENGHVCFEVQTFRPQ